ncbi:hypothetical protein MVEN_02625100 [Mycena venus]|uniref:Uncharacterized protein n=1 Tax=Mycena venus TaxID=2733690 RepID=A0A8H6WQV9_9AGAR|nr:hypothetical protein MVEN_02625100 [Mycena venus]
MFSVLAGHGPWLAETAQIQCYLTLPSLESLEIVQPDIPNQDFISFLTRSSPPLRSLRIAISNLELVAREADDPALELVGQSGDDHPFSWIFQHTSYYYLPEFLLRPPQSRNLGDADQSSAVRTPDQRA